LSRIFHIVHYQNHIIRPQKGAISNELDRRTKQYPYNLLWMKAKRRICKMRRNILRAAGKDQTSGLA
jgi:hypothetical protein